MKSILLTGKCSDWRSDLGAFYHRPGLVTFCAALLGNWAQRGGLGTAVCASLFGLLFWVFPARPRWTLLAVALLFWGAGLNSSAMLESTASAPAVESAHPAGRVEGVWRASKGWRLDVSLDGQRQRWDLAENQPLPQPGDLVRAQLAWRAPPPQTVPGSFHQAAYLRTMDIAAVGQAQNLQIASGSFHVQRPMNRTRTWLRTTFARYLDETQASVAMALLVGEKAQMPQELTQDFRRTGLLHVLSISGFHVALLAVCVVLVLGVLRLGPRAGALVATAALIAYIPLAGSGPSVQRAVLVFALLQAGVLTRLPVDPLNSLGLAGTLILAANPALLGAPGFQLSFGAAFFILYLHRTAGRRIESWPMPAPVRQWLLSPLLISIWATIGTAPVLATHFHALSLVGLLGNLVVIPCIALCMISALLLLLTAPLPWVAQAYGDSFGLFLGIARGTAHLLAATPGAETLTGDLPPALAFLLWIPALLLPPLLGRALWARRALVFFCVLASAGFCGHSLYLYAHPAVRLTFLDAGQGDCTLLEFPDGRNLIVDAGNPRSDGRNFGRQLLIPHLRSRGIGRIDGLLITHPDLDHYGAAQILIEELPVGRVIIGTTASSVQKVSWQRFLSIAKARNIPILVAQGGMRFANTPHGSLHIVHPIANRGRPSLNAQSLVLRLQTPHGCALLMGDAEAPEEAQLLAAYGNRLRCELLKVGHHGARAATSEAFLSAVQPTVAVISAGRNSKYGHPHPDILARLRERNIIHHTTADHGTLVWQWGRSPRTLRYHDGKWTVGNEAMIRESEP